MLTRILGVIAAIAGWIPTDVWVFIIIGGSILSFLVGEGLFTVVGLVLYGYFCYLVLSFAAWILPNWLETVFVLFLAWAFWWTKKG